MTPEPTTSRPVPDAREHRSAAVVAKLFGRHVHALLLCTDVKRGRPAVAGFVGTDNEGHPYWTFPGVEGTGNHLGQDLTIVCPCGRSHIVDGSALRSAALALPRRSGSPRRPPVIHIRDVLRRAV